jgi:hypothetical protein
MVNLSFDDSKILFFPQVTNDKMEESFADRICDCRNSMIQSLLNVTHLRNYMLSQLGIVCTSDKQLTDILMAMCDFLGTRVNTKHYYPLIQMMRENPLLELPGKHAIYFHQEIQLLILRTLEVK